jgi:hypothetical protein
MNAVTNAINGLLHAAMVEATITVTGTATVPHNLGSVPTAVLPIPVGDIGGRCWYDPATLTDTTVDIYVAEPPLEGTYTIKVILYY